MYVKIKNGTKSKQYTLTDNYAKPYIVITNDNKSSVLPLTTKTTSGLYMQVKLSGGTYRPLEYGGSTSETFYTTAVNSAGLSSTTKLTRQSNYTPTVNTKVNTNTYSYKRTTRPENHGSNWTVYYNSKKTQTFVRIHNVTRMATARYNGGSSIRTSWYGDNLSHSYYKKTNVFSYSYVGASTTDGATTAHSKYTNSEVHTRQSQYDSRVDYVTTTNTTTTVASTRESISAYSGVSSSSGSGWN